METKWYLFPGQTLQNTKIEDRGHALHITKDAWKKVTAHLDRNRLRQEAIEKERAHKRALKEGSQQMTRSWENSVENVRKRKQEERETLTVKTMEDKMQRFLVLRGEQEIARQKYTEAAKKSIYIQQQYPKNLTSALISAEVMHERKKQLEVQDLIKEREKKIEDKFAELVKEGAKQEKLEKEEKERRIREKNIEFKNLYRKEIDEKYESNKKSKEESLAKERDDARLAAVENKKLKDIEIRKHEVKKAEVRKYFIDFFEKQAEQAKISEMKEKEQDMFNDVYVKAMHRINCISLRKAKEIQDAMFAKQDASSRQSVLDAKQKAENEERIFKEALAEKTQEEVDKLAAMEEQKQKLIRERKEEREKFLKQEKISCFEKSEQRKWEIANRFKAVEVIKDIDQKKKEDAWKKTLQYRKGLIDQMAENKEAQREIEKEKVENEKLDISKTDEEDRRFFEYADECLHYLKNRGRSTTPVERVITEYKKANGLQLPIIKTCEDIDIKDQE